jgi:hypothetical protein
MRRRCVQAGWLKPMVDRWADARRGFKIALASLSRPGVAPSFRKRRQNV